MYYHIGSLEDEEKPLGVENINWGNEEGRVKLIKCTVVCVVNFTTVVLLLSLFLWSYYNNINNINNYISDLNSYLRNTIHSMESFANINNNISSYSSFNQDILKNKNTLQNLHSYTNSIQPFKASISKVGEIGNLLKVLYIIHSNKEFEFSLKYSVGFNGYLNHLLGIYNNIQNNHIHFTQFSKHRTSIQNQYYPPYIKNKHTIQENKIGVKCPLCNKIFSCYWWGWLCWIKFNKIFSR